jgi:tRNA A-37 threonylcarbamoyl transferase component Bud32
VELIKRKIVVGDLTPFDLASKQQDCSAVDFGLNISVSFYQPFPI